MSIDEIRREDRDAIATVTFTRDDKMNALDFGDRND